MASENFSVRQASALDQRFLWEMLYESLYVPEGGVPFSREVLARREIAKYVDGWGAEGDLGFVALDANSGEPVGAAWLRLFGADDKGYGYVDERTPELGIAVLSEYRGRGVGTELLNRLLEAARDVYASVSLSVSADNPCVRLYERVGFERVGVGGASITMVKSLRA